MNSSEAQFSCRKCSATWPEKVDFCPYCGTKNELGSKEVFTAPALLTVPEVKVPELLVDKPVAPTAEPQPPAPVQSTVLVKQSEKDDKTNSIGAVKQAAPEVHKADVPEVQTESVKPKSKSSGLWVWVVGLIAIAALAGAYVFIFKKTGVEFEQTPEAPSPQLVCPGDPACPKPPVIEKSPPVTPPADIGSRKQQTAPKADVPPVVNPLPRVEVPKTDPAHDALLNQAENAASAGNYQEAASILNGCKGQDSRCSNKHAQYSRLAESSYDCMYSGGSWNVGQRKCN